MQVYVRVLSSFSTPGEIQRIRTDKLDGAGPRGCAVSPDGRFILIAALNDQKGVVWAIREDGKGSPTGKSVKQPNPGNGGHFSVERTPGQGPIPEPLIHPVHRLE